MIKCSSVTGSLPKLLCGLKLVVVIDAGQHVKIENNLFLK